MVTHWRKTFEIRRLQITKSTDQTLVEMFKEWPILKNPNGHSLIIQDFESIDLSNQNLTVEKWEIFFQKIEGCTHFSSKDDQANTLMETLQENDINDSKYFNTFIMNYLKFLMYKIFFS